MLADIHRILAPCGILYAQEQISLSKPVRRQDCDHRTPVQSDLLDAFTRAGFRLLKTNTTDRYRQQGEHVLWCWYQFQKPE